MVLRLEYPEADPAPKKRKREPKPLSAANNIKMDADKTSPKKLKTKNVKSAPPLLRQPESKLDAILESQGEKDVKKEKGNIPEDLNERYPILKDEELIKKFLSVTMTNNQKGRIRQLLKDSLKGTSEFLLPDVINSRIQAIIKSSTELSETELRKIRILYNMLKTALANEKSISDAPKKKNKNKKKKAEADIKEDSQIKNEEVTTDSTKVAKDSVKNVKADKKESKVKNEKTKEGKVKGPKRYVVFVGNLPPNIEKETLMQHFKEFNECIVNIRIPKQPEDKKSSIAYVELKNEPSYELALSKHHSMLGSKRINVLYTTQKNGKISKTEAKSKSAKLIALQKAGKLIGSIPVNRKRSHRRMKMKRAQAKLADENA